MSRMMRRFLPAAAAFVFATGVSGAGVDGRIEKRMSMVEKIFDTTLIDSRFALVSSGENTRGVYLEGYGALFTLEFSFVDDRRRKILENLDDLDDLAKKWRELLEMDEKGRAAAGNRRRVLLEKVKEELTEALLDYGGTLTFLDEGEFVTVAAFPWGESWDVTPEPLSHVVIRAKASDLKDYAVGKIDHDTALSRLDVEEGVQ